MINVIHDVKKEKHIQCHALFIPVVIFTEAEIELTFAIFKLGFVIF